MFYEHWIIDPRPDMDRRLAALRGRGLVASPERVRHVDGQTVISLDVPGRCAEDVQITAADGALDVTVAGTEEHPAIHRRWDVGYGIAVSDVAASVTCGVLRVVVPGPTVSDPQQIEVSDGGA